MGSQVLYKLDKYGNGEEICLEDLPLNHGISFLGFSHNMFLEVRGQLSLPWVVPMVTGTTGFGRIPSRERGMVSESSEAHASPSTTGVVRQPQTLLSSSSCLAHQVPSHLLGIPNLGTLLYVTGVPLAAA
jgi:hypothetical protein